MLCASTWGNALAEMFASLLTGVGIWSYRPVALSFFCFVFGFHFFHFRYSREPGDKERRNPGGGVNECSEGGSSGGFWEGSEREKTRRHERVGARGEKVKQNGGKC